MSAKMTPEEFERMLAGAGPHLARIMDDKPDLSPERINALTETLNTIQPFLRELPVEQMRTLILNVLSEHPMDGSALIDLIHKNNFRLKGATGEGELFGLLYELERMQMIQVTLKSGEEIFSLTELGRAENERISSEAVELGSSVLRRSAV